MQVVNRKDRSNAKWRFAGLYILSLALPALLIFNANGIGKVEDKENEQLVEQLKKRDQALAELSQLAAILQETQELKPAYVNEPLDPAKYDQLRYRFVNEVDKLKRLYYSDTALYKSNYNLLSFLENNHKDYNQVGDEFRNKVDEEVARKLAAMPKDAGGGGGGGNQAQIMILEKELAKAEKIITRLEDQVANAGNGNAELQRLKERALAVEANIDQITTVLSGIEEDCNKIQKRGDDNLKIKSKILERVRFLKNHVAGIKNTNKNLVGMID